MKERIYHWCKKILILPAWPTILIAVPSFAALIWYFVIGNTMQNMQLIEIPVYCLSAYALIISCTCIWKGIRRIQKFVQGNVIWQKLQGDVRLRTTVTMIPSALLNMIYVATNIGMGVINHAEWFIYLGVYYLLLTLMKIYLLHNLVLDRIGSNDKKEWQKYRNCGIVLLLLNFVLNAECVYIVTKHQDFHYDGMLIYVMAAMAFYNLTMAVVNVIHYRKYKSPVLSAVKAINLTTAMVTMLALETAMISQFGSADEESFRQIMTSITAAVVCVVEIVTAVYMIYNGTRKQSSI